ncbi:hypothetical protein [Nocardioides abyssi]|uniref:Uncharacterized protein n=1 Tax=Nocardioides abyssi TaxID=3058370 RepID=A0ABT8EXP3_9ACTN|nr:hypothetical protein [Nocardioides abyssi]MDN4162945.1 hypothetical protein [Nocardioides abyssi]
MTKLWHPHFKDLSIERDDEFVDAHVAAGWLKAKPRREFIETEVGESTEEAIEEAREEKPKPRKAKADSE